MKGGSFLLRRLAKIPSRMVQVLHRGVLPQHLRFAIKHNQPGRNPGQCFALKCGHFSVGVFGICFQTIQFCHNHSNRQVGTWLGRWIPFLTQISTCKTLNFSRLLWVYFWKGRVAVLILPPLDASILAKLVQSQQRVKGYWIWIQSQSTVTSVWAQAEGQCLLRDAHRIVRSTCLDGAPWSQNKRDCVQSLFNSFFGRNLSTQIPFWNVSDCQLLDLCGLSSWQRFSYNLARVWNWAQERSSVHLSGMLSPLGQSLEQFLHKTHFQLSGSRPISGVARRVGSVIQPVRRAVPQLIPEGLGTIFHLAVARNVEHPFLRPPTTYNPVVYATEYAIQSVRDCIAQRLDVAETLQELADSLFEENLHALRSVDPFLLPVVARRNLLVMREVSVVISWVDPKLIVDLFFGLHQLGWAMPAPTMQLREAPLEYPIETLKTDCGNHLLEMTS